MQKGQTHAVGYAVGTQYTVGMQYTVGTLYALGIQYAVGMQYAVGTQYTVGVSAKRSTHTVDLANKGVGTIIFSAKRSNPHSGVHSVQ